MQTRSAGIDDLCPMAFHRKRLNKVLRFMTGHLHEDLPLEKLAGVADYSPYHFQRIFREAFGESPRRYLIRMRLETAAHLLVMQRYKPVSAIALESGYASPSTFARAFKDYFGVSAEGLRALPEADRFHLLEIGRYFGNPTVPAAPVSIEVKRRPPGLGISVTTTLHDEKKIQDAFLEAFLLAQSRRLPLQGARFIGVFLPHQSAYRAMVSLPSLPANIDRDTFEGGTFASFQVRGGLEDLFPSMKNILDDWLSGSGYGIRAPFAIEVWGDRPWMVPYTQGNREVFVPLEPVISPHKTNTPPYTAP